MTDLLAAALANRDAGFPVLPLKRNDEGKIKVPDCPAGWDRWFTQRQTEAEVRGLFRNGALGLGRMLYPASPFVVLDFDGPHAFEAWKQTGFSLDGGARVTTQSGGVHVYFVVRGNKAQINQLKRAIRLVKAQCDCQKTCGVDLLINGYAVAPPTPGYHEDPDRPLESTVEIPPEIISFALSRQQADRGSTAHERLNTAQALTGVPEGQRDETIFKLACKLQSADVPRDIAETLILEAARKCRPSFSEKLALEKVARVYGKYEPKSEEKKTAASGHGFKLVCATDLLASAEPDTRWLWDGVLPEGGMSLVVGKPKAGKSTFAFALTLAVADGREFLRRPTAAGPVVYLALEEKRAEVKKKLEAFGGQVADIFFHFGAAPPDAVAGFGELIKETKAKLLVIDVLQKFIRVRDLNDYALVTNALEPLLTTARESGCHVLLTHHAGKADRPDGDEVLGSTALLGGVDTLVSIKKREHRRTFFTIQRYGEDTPETVIELTPQGGLAATGTRQDVDVADTMPAILEVLSDGELAREDILDRVEHKRSLVLKALAKLCDEKRIERTGTGKKGDPYVYKKNSVFPFPDTIGNGGTESKSPSNSASPKDLFRSRDFSEFDSVPEMENQLFLTEKEGRKPWE